MFLLWWYYRQNHVQFWDSHLYRTQTSVCQEKVNRALSGHWDSANHGPKELLRELTILTWGWHTYWGPNEFLQVFE